VLTRLAARLLTSPLAFFVSGTIDVLIGLRLALIEIRRSTIRR
jgi:hypothetical protein